MRLERSGEEDYISDPCDSHQLPKKKNENLIVQVKCRKKSLLIGHLKGRIYRHHQIILVKRALEIGNEFEHFLTLITIWLTFNDWLLMIL